MDCITDPEIIQAYLKDASNIEGFADTLVRPKTTEEVAEIMRHCQANSIPITVTAQRTSTTGGPVPQGGWLLDTSWIRSAPIPMFRRRDFGGISGRLSLKDFFSPRPHL